MSNIFTINVEEVKEESIKVRDLVIEAEIKNNNYINFSVELFQQPQVLINYINELYQEISDLNNSPTLARLLLLQTQQYFTLIETEETEENEENQKSEIKSVILYTFHRNSSDPIPVKMFPDFLIESHYSFNRPLPAIDYIVSHLINYANKIEDIRNKASNKKQLEEFESFDYNI